MSVAAHSMALTSMQEIHEYQNQKRDISRVKHEATREVGELSRMMVGIAPDNPQRVDINKKIEELQDTINQLAVQEENIKELMEDAQKMLQESRTERDQNV